MTRQHASASLGPPIHVREAMEVLEPTHPRGATGTKLEEAAARYRAAASPT